MTGRAWRFGVLPLTVFYTVFLLLPQAAFLAIGCFRGNGPGQIGEFVGASNYAHILSDHFFQRAIVNTFVLGGGTAIASVIVAFPIAYAIAKSQRVGKYLFILVLATMFSSAVALALGWQTLLAPNGGINELLLSLHLIDQPLPLSANFSSVLIGTVHAMVPVAVLGLVPACEAVPQRQIEAAIGLAASRWTVFCDIILPQTVQSLLSMGLIVFAVAISAFTTPALLGGGRVALLSLAIWQELLTVFDYPTAAALASVLILTAFVLTLLTRLMSRRRSRGQRLSGAV